MVLCMTMLAGCDMSGGEKGDTNLYHLVIKPSSNITETGLNFEAKLAFGERHDINVRPEDEVEALLSDGASQTDIDKAGVKQSDGSYYFFAADPIIVTVPELEGYIFVGFYNKETGDLYRPMLSKTRLDDGTEVELMSRWNMPGKDTVLEARYKNLEYKISYCYGFDKSRDALDNPLPSGLMPAGTHSNPQNYVYANQKDVTLTAPTETFAGYEFDYWYYREDYTGNKIKVTTLPKTYEEGVLHATVDANDVKDCELTLFAEYKELDYTLTINVKNGDQTITNVDNFLIFKQNGENVELDERYPYGTSLFLMVDVAELDVDGYILEGIYVNDVKVPDIEPGRISNVADITITNDTVIDVKVSSKPCEVFFDIDNEGYDEIIIVGNETTVNDVLAFPEGVEYQAGDVVYTNANSNIILKVKLSAGYNVTEHSIDYVPVEGEVEGDYTVYTFEISHEFETIILSFDLAE